MVPEPETEPDAATLGCLDFFFVAPTPDVPYETRGMLVTLIVLEARAQLPESAHSLDTLIELAAADVVARFPAEAMPALRPHLADATADALDRMSAAAY